MMVSTQPGRLHFPTKTLTISNGKFFQVNAVANEQLIVLYLTVPPAQQEGNLSHMTNTRFVYNPYLIAMGNKPSGIWLIPEMVMIGTEDGSETGDAKQLVDYKTIMQNEPCYEIGTWDECECIKVFYNTFIFVKVSLVNMIQDVAEKQGNINAEIVCDALARSDRRIMGPADI